MSDFVIANTCIWEKSSNKQILYYMMNINKKAVLWFSKQTLSLEENYNLRQSTLLSNVGTFGFNTSLSERLLFSNRHKGFMKAVSFAFDKVSPIIYRKIMIVLLCNIWNNRNQFLNMNPKKQIPIIHLKLYFRME